MYMIMFVLDDPDRLDEILGAWEAVGVSGVTIIESTGLARHVGVKRVGSPLMAGINRILQSDQEGHYTLMTIVSDEQVVTACARAAESIVGPLTEPHTGVLAAWPVPIVHGVRDLAAPATEK
jgi:hypothetical protein